MSYSQLPAQLDYPPVNASAWVVISRLSESPIRTVPNLSLVNHASEIALPFPSGKFPLKVVKTESQVQDRDDLDRPLYDDGGSGTTSDVDMDGNPLPPKLVTETIEKTVSLQDAPTLFTADEVFKAIEQDFLKSYPFYDSARLILFDDRFDGVSTYQNKQRCSGLGSGSHPLFLGPFQANLSVVDNPSDVRGHVMLVAPVSLLFNYHLQVRHGLAGTASTPAGTSPYKGPIEDVAQASRLNEIYHLFPLENLPLTKDMMQDFNDVDTSHFWIRSVSNGIDFVPDQLPVIPWIILMIRNSGTATPLGG